MRRFCPLNLGKGCHTRKNLPFHLKTVTSPFSPDTSLSPYDILFFFLCQFIRYRFESINTLKALCSLDAIVGRITEIEVLNGSHYSVMMQTRCLYAASGTCPRHNGCPRSQASFKHFIPSQHLTSSLTDYFSDFSHKIGLQPVFFIVFRSILQSQFANLRLTLRTFFPAYLRTFVSTDMNVRGRKNIHYFI